MRQYSKEKRKKETCWLGLVHCQNFFDIEQGFLEINRDVCLRTLFLVCQFLVVYHYKDSNVDMMYCFAFIYDPIPMIISWKKYYIFRVRTQTISLHPFCS